MRVDETSAKALPDLVCALLASMIAVLLAAYLAASFLPLPYRPDVMPAGLLPWVRRLVLLEPREKSFYLGALTLGTLAAWFGARRRLTFTLPLPQASILLLLLAALANFLIGQYLNSEEVRWWSGLIPLIAVFEFFRYTRSFQNSIDLASAPITELKTLLSAPNLRRVQLWGLALLLIMLVPSSLSELAASVGYNMHAVSFMFGPATYFYGHGLLPGIDYFSQYSLGLGWLFHPLLGDSADDTLRHYGALVTVLMIAFHIAMFYLLAWLYDSWKTAGAITFVMLVFMFTTNRAIMAPSSLPMRYPLLLAVAALLVAWVRNPKQVWRLAALSAALGASVFINTETGIYMLIATCLSAFANCRVAIIPSLALLIALSFCWFTGLLYLAYGDAIFSMEFVQGNTLPMLIYGAAGMGGIPVNWNAGSFTFGPQFFGEYHLLYNVIAPGLAVATFGLALSRRITGERALCVTFFALMGLLMSAKYLNMSIVGLWQVNALGFMVTLGFWIQAYLSASRGVMWRNVHWDRIGRVGVIVGMVALTALVGDRGNITAYGLQSWVHYPTIPHMVGRLFRHKCHTLSCEPDRPSDTDIALIKARGKPGEPLALIDLHDWTYLIATHRPSMASFLPSDVIFVTRDLEQTRERFEHAQYVFLPAPDEGLLGTKDGAFDDVEIAEWLIPEIQQHFTLDGVGDKLVAWRRISPHTEKAK